MDSLGAAIISDDGSLTESMDRQLRDLRGWELARATTAEWVSGQTQWVRPRVLFIDLRPTDSPLWNELESMAERLKSLRGEAPTLIGILDPNRPAVPIHAAVAADTIVSDFTTLDTAESLSESLERSQRRTRATLPERRELRGTTHSFSTCTPELFVPMERLQTVAKSDFSILLIGETGTGKTTLAKIIHELSSRCEERFMPVACGALPGDLIDSELFGHVQGAFTGADRNKEGKFDAVGRGTLLLDEIDVLENLQQAKLLRVLESGEFEPVGSNDTRRTRCRTVVASNLRLEALIEKGKFRSDLYYRLDEMKFEIPPLRARPLDIAPLAVQFILECCEEQGQSVTSVTADFLQAIRNHTWPGNIRELRNEMRRAALFAEHGLVSTAVLRPAVLQGAANPPNGLAASVADLAPMRQDAGLADEIALTERETIERMLRQQDCNRAATARALGISRVTLYNKIRKYRIDLDQK